MKAVRCIDGRMQLCDVPAPVPGDGQVLVSVASAGICSSDLHMARLGLLDPQVTVGHEIAGRLLDGTPVVVEPVTPCGQECAFCDGGDYNLCPTSVRQVLGIGADGGMAEYVAADVAGIVPLGGIGDGVRDASLVEPLAVGVHGLRLANPGAGGGRVLVIGGGALGLCAAAAARHDGAEVAVLARHDAQRAAADRIGAGEVGDGRYDLVVDAAGTPEALAEAARRARRGGTLLLLANYWGTDIVLPGGSVMFKELRILTGIMYGRGPSGRDIEAAAAVLEANPDVARALVTHRFPLDAVDEAFAAAARRAEGAIKVVLDPTAS
ncbi:MAG: alcohol dehydrogenase catalytic domain-containing protein [bacterium]|nr:alcohol dehydrogenase catalytic domain-containing protein [bacterium]MXV90742.1 alcohol dehydrogenase catalytic domain-containing protein [Acidimicrobiia bacterium]MYI19789.1 alcohol dehydrogenase catalytic domain-containing protein [Acidimicrobiia bacterium]